MVLGCLRIVFGFSSGLGCCLWCFSLCTLGLWLLVMRAMSVVVLFVCGCCFGGFALPRVDVLLLFVMCRFNSVAYVITFARV